MGENQAYLTTDLPLRRMIEVLERASSEIRPALSASQDSLLPKLRRLETRLEGLHQDVRSAERWLDEARSWESDDDDYDGGAVAAAETQLEEALDRLQRGTAAMEIVSEKVDRFRRAAADLDATPIAISRAKEYLWEQIDALGQYRAIVLGLTQSNGAAATSRPAPPSPPDLPKLPAGFAWVPIDAISPSELELDPNQWRKVDRETMKTGVKRLFAELVPLMLERSTLNRADLERRDAELGRVDQSGLVHEQSLAHLYDVFFSGSEPIAGWQTPEGKWKLHNGRHRAKVAQEMNFTHVPLKVTNG